MAGPTQRDDQGTEPALGPVQPPTLPSPLGPMAPPPLAAVPGYEIEGELGRGGMGVVYRARQVGLDRPCALKMVLAAGHADQADLARFRAEAQAVARLQHPGIVQIYEVGECEGRPYYSMEFCPGGALDQKLDGTPLPPRQAADLVRGLALAVQAAHDAQVVHRDLKPANVLFAADGTPKIADFGLARKLDEPGQTRTGAVMGTPSYMAPEQAEAKKDVGPAADVYALGAILYECLTGRPPFKATTALDTMLQVVHQEPAGPRSLNPLVPIDLETIALKCLHKQPARRYASAAELAADLGRHLAGEPILARPAHIVERALNLARRYPGITALVLLALFLTAAGVAGISWAWWAARQAQQRAETHLYFSRISLAERELSHGNVARAAELLDSCSPALARWEWRYLNRQLEGGSAWHQPAEWACALAWLDGQRLAHGSDEGQVLVREAPSGKLLAAFRAEGPVRRILPTAAGLLTLDAYGTRQQWRLGAAQPVSRHADAALRDVAGPQRGLSAEGNDQGKVSLIGPKGLARSWDDLKSPVHRVALSADGRAVAASSFSGGAVWAASGQKLFAWPAEAGSLAVGLALSPSADLLALASADGQARVVRLADGKAQVAVRALALDVAFAPSGHSFATAGADNVVRIWDARTGQELLALRGHTDRVLRVAFSPDGRWLASAGADGAVRLWDAQDGPAARVLRRHTDNVFALAAHPRLPLAASVDASRKLIVWRLQDGSVERSLQLHRDVISSVAFSHDGKLLATGSWDGTVLVRHFEGDEDETLSLTGHKQQVTSVAFHPTRPVLASASYDRSVRLWSLESGEELHALEGHTDDVWSVAFSPDGKLLASASYDKTVRIWDAQAGTHLRTLAGHTDPVLCVAFAPQGALLASAGVDCLVRLWEPTTGEPKGILQGHTDVLFHVGFSPTGERLVSAGGDRTIRVWDVRSGELAVALAGHTDLVRHAAFSHDERYLVSCGRDRTVRVWDGGPVDQKPAGPDDGSLARALSRLDAPGAAWRRQRLAALEGSGLPEALLGRARRALGRQLEGPERLNAAAWQAALAPDKSGAEYRQAVAWAEGALRLQPGEPRYLNTLAVALYRAKRYRHARASALASLAVDRSLRRDDTPFNLAILAMAAYQMKEGDEARRRLRELQTRMKAAALAGGPDAQALAAEAQRLVGGP